MSRVSPGVPETPAETPPPERPTPQVSGEIYLPGSVPGSQNHQPENDNHPHRCYESSTGQGVSAWAAELAAALPPLTASQAVGVARIAGRLGVSSEADVAGQEY